MESMQKYFSKIFNKANLHTGIFNFRKIYSQAREKIRLFKRNINQRKLKKPNYKIFLFYPLIFLPKIAKLEEEEKKESTLEKKDIIRGEYENKIRIFSSIEKRFLIFSKITKKEEKYKMTYYQFLDSLVPFQYIKTKSTEEIEKVLSANPHFNNIMKKIDINGDKYISFEEYIILCVLSSVSLKEYFDQFPSGKLTRESLAEFLMDKISKIESLKITNKSMVDGRMIKTDYNTLYRNMVDFVSLAFDKVEVDIKKDISNILFEVYLLLLFYEFYRIPESAKDNISRENFAKVILSYANIYKNKLMLKKIEEKSIDMSGEISFDEYLCFFWFLKCLTIEKDFFNDQVTVEDLRKKANDVLKTMPNPGFKFKKEISEKSLHMFIDLLDDNGDKKLSPDEVNDILKRRTFYSASKNDFKDESKSISRFFHKGYNFIKENLWFLK